MRSALIVTAILVATPALAQQNQSTGKVAGDIATTPLQDANIKTKKIPAILAKANDDPYSLAGVGSCAALGAEVGRLSEVLGPDFDSPEEVATRGAKRGRAAAGVARGVVQALIPFRGVVREVSGAAGAERRYEAAVDAGIARRGFLRGTARARRCAI